MTIFPKKSLGLIAGLHSVGDGWLLV